MRFTSFAKSSLLAAAVLSTTLAVVPAQAQQNTLKVVMHSDLKIVDPIWTTAYITRNHGYMIYDTLFAMDAKGDIKPQMVDKYSVSADGLLWTFTLRDGLLFHDDKPVTADDAVASIKRWAAKDSLGQKMNSFVKEWKVVDAKTFTATMNAPTGLMLLALGKPSSNVPFIMPKRIAETSPNEQIKEYIGSGPFVFRADQWKPGDQAVYTKFAKYKPRAEPPSGMAGGKVAKVDRVEWHPIPDPQTAVNALITGEVDMVEEPKNDLLPTLAKDPNDQAVRPESARQPVRAALQHHPQALRQSEGASGDVLCAEPGRLPEGSARRCRSTTSCARRCSSAARRWPRTRAWTASSNRTSRSRANCSPRPATTARRWCCCTPPTWRC